MKIKYILICVLFLVTIALGFLRDYVFVSINRLIESGNDTSGHLLILKWVLTFFCSALYMVIASAFVWLLFKSPKYIWIIIGIYSLLFLVAFIVGVIGYFTISFARVYPFIRTILGILQSPIVMMILIPACFLNDKMHSKGEQDK